VFHLLAEGLDLEQVDRRGAENLTGCRVEEFPLGFFVAKGVFTY
jgi:hypothetical protein